MIKNIAKLFGLTLVSFALGCSGNVDGSDESLGGKGGTNAAGASGQAGSSGSSGNAGSAGVSGQAGSSGPSGSGGSSSQGGSSGASGTGGTAGEAGASGTGGNAGEAGAAGAGNDAGTDATPPSVLFVSLSPVTPPGMNMCDGAQTAVLSVDFTNASDIDIALPKLRLHRFGAGSQGDIVAGGIVGDYAVNGIPDGNGYVTLDVGYAVMAKTTKTVTYWARVKAGAGDQFGFEVEDASSVMVAGNAVVQGMFPAKGNTFTLLGTKCGNLAAQLAQTPGSQTVVKKSQGVEVVGFKFTAGINDMRLIELPLKCQASINGAPFTAADCWKRVTSLAAFDGTMQVGLAKAPNTDDGIAVIKPNWLVPNGMTRTLTVKASFASTASQTEPYDRIAIGIADSAVAEDMVYGQTVAVSTDPKLAGQLSQSPEVVVTVLNSGTLKIEADGHPAAQIVVGGKDVWTVVASYKATAEFESATIDQSSVIQDSLHLADNADVTAVAVASNGVIHGQTVLPAGDTGCSDADMSGYAIQLPKDVPTSVQVWVKYAAPMPGSAVNGAQHGVARSGHQPRVGLSSGIMGGEWSTGYLNRFNLRTTGDASGERLYAASTGVAKPNAMVLRKSRPIFVKQQTPFGVLGIGQQDLYRYQVSADGISDQVQQIVPSVAIKQYSFDVKFEGCSPVLSNAKLYRGASEIPGGDYSLVDGYTGADLRSGSMIMASGSVYRLVAAFANEEVVSGSGYLYELSANLSEVKLGCSMTTKLAQDSNPVVKTGYLLQNDAFAPYTASYGIFNVGMWPDQNGLGAWHVQGTQVWSDQSELPHIALTLPSSADWTTDYLVNDLTLAQVKVCQW